jgi:hypothetical protein
MGDLIHLAACRARRNRAAHLAQQQNGTITVSLSGIGSWLLLAGHDWSRFIQPRSALALAEAIQLSRTIHGTRHLAAGMAITGTGKGVRIEAFGREILLRNRQCMDLIEALGKAAREVGVKVGGTK